MKTHELKVALKQYIYTYIYKTSAMVATRGKTCPVLATAITQECGHPSICVEE
jgi:hypothetical protein